MKSPTRSVDLNNQACLLLLKKKQAKAIKALKMAHKDLKETGNSLSEGTECSYQFCSFDENPFRTIEISEENVFSNESSSRSWKFYNRALVINNLTGATNKEVDVKSRVAILYNIGLIYHQEGLTDRNVQRLVKALKSYELSISILKSSKESIPVEDRTILFLPLLNNIVHIHSLLSNDKKANASAELMQFILKSLEEDFDEIRFAEEERRFLKRNIKTFVRKQLVQTETFDNEEEYKSCCNTPDELLADKQQKPVEHQEEEFESGELEDEADPLCGMIITVVPVSSDDSDEFSMIEMPEVVTRKPSVTKDKSESFTVSTAPQDDYSSSKRQSTSTLFTTPRRPQLDAIKTESSSKRSLMGSSKRSLMGSSKRSLMGSSKRSLLGSSKRQLSGFLQKIKGD